MKKFLVAMGLVFTSMTAPAWADDQSEIVASMKGVWDKPDNPLTVKPVIVADNFAIAGWFQGKNGGRALLKKDHHDWKTQLCAGKITSALLQQAGVPIATAKQLLVQQTAAEKEMTKADLAQLSSFSGVVKISDKTHHHGHEQH